VSGRALYVPSLPTLRPGMLVRRGRPSRFPPFSVPDARYYYFARNAIWLLVKAWGLHTGEVLMPAYHHGVEVEAVVDAGAAVRFYRVGSRWDVDLDDVERKIGPETRAIFLVHYAGFAGPAAAMRELADRRGLPLIEDCALSLLAADGTRLVGTTGDAGVFCLYKTLPVPNGGALIVNRPRPWTGPVPSAPPLASTVNHVAAALLHNLEMRGGTAGRRLRSAIRRVGHGAVHAAKIERIPTGTLHFNREHLLLGMSALSRRIGLAQDTELIVAARRANYAFLRDALGEVAPPLLGELPRGACPLFYPLRVQEKAAVLDTLRARGIDAIDFWDSFHPSCDAAAFPEVAELRRSIVEIPCHQDLGEDVLIDVAAAVREAVSASRRWRPR
jgi:dTDP-4-amino-4,6-dideoxygalactose transaminase